MEKILLGVLVMILINIFPFHIKAQAPIQTVSVERVMIGINTKRTEANQKSLKMDQDLCTLADTLAEDSEKTYPKEIGITDNPDYMKYLRNYSLYKTSKVTYNDALVKAAKGDKSFLKMDENFLISSFVLKDKIALSPELTHACVGVSSAQSGYKPFAFFVGGERKIEDDSKKTVIITDILKEMIIYLKSLLFK
jgi:hypothetical protein